MAAVRVAIETTAKRCFATAIDWPGWSRAGKTEEEALARLADHAPRYARVVAAHALPDRLTFKIVEHVSGGAGTEFGVPSTALADDADALDDAELERYTAILSAAWSAFDAAARHAEGLELRKGPRGGGRDLTKIVGHILEAEEAYLVQLGQRRPRVDGDVAQRMTVIREAALATLRARAHGLEPADPSGTRKRWSPRYFVRRSAWHALDHAWEIEDRAIH